MDDGLGAGFFSQTTSIHDQNSISDLVQNGDIVGDKDHAAATTFLQEIHQHFSHRFLAGNIQG